MFNISMNLDDLRRACMAAPVRIRLGVIDAVKKASHEGARVAREAKWQDRTGHTRAQIRSLPTKAGARVIQGGFESPALHSNLLEDGGKKAYYIFPKASYNTPKRKLMSGQTRRGRGRGPKEYVVGRGIALRWVEGGQSIYRAFVFHRPSRAFHYMRTATQAALRELEVRVNIIFGRLFH